MTHRAERSKKVRDLYKTVYRDKKDGCIKSAS